MLTNKSFLIGLGCGLIAGAVFLQLMVNADGAQTNNSGIRATPLTQEQLQQEAAKLNMKVISKDQQSYSQQQIDEIKQKAVQEEMNKAAKASPVPSATPTSSPSIPAPSTVPEGKVIFIPDQTDATTVANLLVQNQIISEPGKLLGLLVEQKLTEKIQYGNHTFKEHMDLNEIVTILTKKP